MKSGIFLVIPTEPPIQITLKTHPGESGSVIYAFSPKKTFHPKSQRAIGTFHSENLIGNR
jgi:hypothetical protein